MKEDDGTDDDVMFDEDDDGNHAMQLGTARRTMATRRRSCQ
jgi:hypothetical protein